MRSCSIEWNGQVLAWATVDNIQTCVDAYIADRVAASKVAIDRQALLDRLWALACNVTPPTNGGGINSADQNRYLALEDKDLAPWYGAKTYQEDPSGVGGGAP